MVNCACNCGAELAERSVKRGFKYLSGHNSKGENNNNCNPKSIRSKYFDKSLFPRKVCACGCGIVASAGRKYIQGHNMKEDENKLFGENNCMKKETCQRP
mgnify:CR=1 FL=1